MPGHPFAYTDGAPCATGASELSAMGTISVDLAACAERQGGFLWQVRWAEYEREDFLCDALARYGKLVGLWATTEDTFLVPTYDIDLMWHAHMANPAAYAADCMRLIGRLIGHDDSDTDRAFVVVVVVIRQADCGAVGRQIPRHAWHTRRAMWRGEPPRWYYEEPLLAVNVGEALSPSWSWWRSTSISPPPSPAANVEIDHPDAALARVVRAEHPRAQLSAAAVVREVCLWIRRSSRQQGACGQQARGRGHCPLTYTARETMVQPEAKG